MTTTNSVAINEIPLNPTDPTKTAWGPALSAQYYFVIANGTAAAESFDAADLSASIRALMAQYGRGVSVSMGAGDDSVTGSSYGDVITVGDGVNYVDGGANSGEQPGGGAARDVLNVFVANQAAADALGVTAIAADATGVDADAYAAGYRIKLTNGSETDYLKNVEQVNVFLTGGGYLKTVRLAVDVYDNYGTQDPAAVMHLAWVQGTSFDDSFSAASDISAATRGLMTQHGRGVWVDLGAGNDTVTGSGFGDDITAGSGTNYVDGGANAGSPPWGGKAQDVLHVVVANQADAAAVQVSQLAAGATGADAQAFSDGYTHKVSANGETDYVKGIERVSIEVGGSNGSSWVRDVPLTVVAQEANLAAADIDNYYHLAWVNGTANNDVIDAGGDTALLSAELKAAMAQKGRGIWIDGGAGDDTITGTAYADNFRNGAGNSKIDGGANTGGMDVFEISVASTAEMNAVQVQASDDPAYTWMVSYGADGQKDYLKNVEAITVNVAGTSVGKWIPLAVQVTEIGSGNLDTSMHYAWAQGTGGADSFSAAAISAATRDLMTQHGRGVWVDMGAGNDTVTGSGFGDDITAGSGTNYVDGGANAGSPPWGGKAQDVLHVVVANQADAAAVQVSQLAAGATGADAQAFSDGYTHKVSANGETDYVKGIERVSIEVGGSNGSSWVRDVPLTVVAQEANLAAADIDNYYHLAWVNGTANNDVIDAGGDTALLSAELKAAMAQKGRGIWIDGGAGDDTITGSGYADNFRNGAGNSKIDGGANTGGTDVFEISVASTAEMNAVQVQASDDPAYTWMVSYGAGGQKDYLKNVEAITVNVAGTSVGKWIPLAVQVTEIGSGNLDTSMHYAWAQGTGGADSFSAAAISAATRDLMTQHGRGVWVDLGEGNDTVTGSGFGDDITAGAGTNYVDGGANAGSPPWGGKAQDVLHVVVANQADAAAVQVSQLAAGATGADAQAFADGYTHKVSANGEIDYVKGIERVSIEVGGSNGSSWVRDIPLTVVAQEANLAASDINNYYHLAWVNGTANNDSIDAGGDTALLSAALKSAMTQKGRGIWIDAGAGNDTVKGTDFGDTIVAGAGTNYVDGGANQGAQPGGAAALDRLEIYVASQAAADAVSVTTLSATSTGADGAAFADGYRYKVGNGTLEINYVKNVEQVAIIVWNDKDGDGVRDGAAPGDPANELTPARTMTLGQVPNTAPSFNGAPAGVAVFDAGRDFGILGATVLPNGKMLGLSYISDMATGTYYSMLVRANADGSSDTSFGGGTGGVILPSYGNGPEPLVLADGKIVVGLRTAANGELKIMRFNVDGSSDTSFGNGGAATVTVGTGNTVPRKLLADADGKLVLVGQTVTGTNSDMAIIRLNADGSLDNSFNGSGKLVLAPSAGNDVAYDAVFQADGKLLLAGYTTGADGSQDWALARVNKDGSYDTGFGNGGKVALALGASNDLAWALQVLGSGKIVVAGSTRTGDAASDTDQVLMRFNSDGSVDTGFGSNGKTVIHLSDRNELVGDMQVQADGKIVVLSAANVASNNLGGDFAVTRYNADGSLDTSFGSGGTARLSVHGVGESTASLAIVGGKIVVFGSSYNDSNYDTSSIIYRLNADGSLDTSFAPNPVSSLDASVRSTGASPVVLDNNVSIYDAELAAAGNYGGASVVLARHGGASADDVFGGAGDVSIADGQITVGKSATAPGTVIGTASQAGGTLTLSFNAAATQGLVNRALHGITYQNGNPAAPSQVTIDWTFNDGNNGAQGPGGAKSAAGSTLVEIGILRQEVARNPADPTKSAGGQPLSQLAYLGTITGSTRGDSFDASTGFSAAAKGLMDEFKRGAYFDMGAGDDTVTGTGYGDQFVMGAGVNRVDGGAHAGADPSGNAARDILSVFAATDAQAAAVSVSLLDAGAAGADADARAAGYTVKVVNGNETDYLKNVEAVQIFKWADTNGNGLRDAGETSWVREVPLALRVNEITVSATDPAKASDGRLLSEVWHLANGQGSPGADSFNAATDVSATTQALMASQGRGVWVDAGAGNDTLVGSAYGDNFIGGDGVNRIDGGANGGSTPTGQRPYDILEIYARTEAAAKDVQAVQLTPGMGGADADAFNAGYTFKVVSGNETDYVKNVEGVNVFLWTDTNGNGVRDGAETSFNRLVRLATMVDEVSVSKTDPTKDASGNLLSTYGQLAWANGGIGADSFDASVDVSSATRTLMAQFNRGVSTDMGAGNDTVVGSSYGDYFVVGAGTNRIDGGANGGTDQGGNAARDTLDVYVADQAAADAVTAIKLSAASTGADGEAFAQGYLYKVANGSTEIDYLKNVEQLNIQIWNDKDGDGQRDYSPQAALNEVTYVRGVNLADVTNAPPHANVAPTFGAPAGMGVIDAGHDLTPTGAVTLANGKTVVLALLNQVESGVNYVLALLSRNADGSADTGFGGGSGMVLLPTVFGSVAKPAVQADGKIVIAVSTSLTTTSDFKIVRFNQDGSLDTGFGSNGETVVSLGSRQDQPTNVLVQADGKIVVVGTAASETDRDFGVVRLNADGSLDTSFNGSGKMVAALPAGRDAPTAATFDGQGGIILAGSSQVGTGSDAAVIRVKPDGTLDTAFNGGQAFLPIGPNRDFATGVTTLASGKILVAGDFYVSPDNSIDTSFALMRLNADGSLDTTFGSGGKLALSPTTMGDRLYQVLEQADGKIVASGWINGQGNNGGKMVVVRMNADGSLDTSFGDEGGVEIPLLGQDARPLAMSIVGGKIVLMGAASYNTNFDASTVLVRLNADGSFDTSFNPNPAGSLNGTVKMDGLHPAVLDFNATVYDADLADGGSYGGATLTLARDGGASADDHFWSAGEVGFENGNLRVGNVTIGTAEQSNGTLTLHFNQFATQDLVTRAMHGIAYTNSAANPPASVQIDWSFNDGNTGSQGSGGSATASASSTVQIGVTVHEVVRAYTDPALATDGRALAGIDYFAEVDGTAQGASVSSANLSTATRALMDTFQRGVDFEMGAGDDTVTGSAYSDWIVAGKGTNRVDGGANIGDHPYGGEGRDTLIVYARSTAEADAVSVVRLEAGMSGADADAFNAGYEAKIVNGGEIDYIKNIENADVHLWTDTNGNGVVDGAEGQFVRGLEFRMRVGAQEVGSNDPKTMWNMAWVDGTRLSDSFDAARDLPADAKALMDQYQRGVYANLKDGNDSFVGSVYGDNITAGPGINRIDGGANLGTDPAGYAARDRLTLIVTSDEAAKALQPVALSAGMIDPADLAAFNAGYTYKLATDNEIDYVRNVESVDVLVWKDANGDGLLGNGEIVSGHNLGLAVELNELRVKATDPTVDEYDAPLAQINSFADFYGTIFGDTVEASNMISAATMARMQQYGHGASFEMHGGGDKVTGTQFGDMFVFGQGVNYVDGGAQQGSHPWGQSADIVDIFVGSIAERDAVKLVALTGNLSGADAAAQAAGYQYKIVAGGEIDYVKGIEQYNVSVWEDKDGDGQRDYANDASTEVTGTVNITVPDPAQAQGITVVGVPPQP